MNRTPRRAPVVASDGARIAADHLRRPQSSRLALLIVLAVVAPALRADDGAAASGDAGWQIETNVSYDALALINALGGDPFYVDPYIADLMYLRRSLDDGAIAAAERLLRTKERFGFVQSAFTSMLASGVEVTSLEDLIGWFERPSAVMEAYRGTPWWRWYHAPLFRLFVRRDTVTVLRGLAAGGFDAYWEERLQPRLDERAATLAAESTGWHVRSIVETRLGHPIDPGPIRVILVYFGRPHAYRVQGNAFVTAAAYPTATIAANAIHELFHPPVDWSDPAMRDLLRQLRESDLISTAYERHDRSYGYNYWEGYIEESIVRFLEQLAAEALGFATRDAAPRWREDDGGMHVFAAILTARARETGYDRSDEDVTAFLTREFVARAPDEAELMRLYRAGTR